MHQFEQLGEEPLHCELFTHWLFFEQPLQQRSHTHGVSVGFGPQPAVTPLGLQQTPAHALLQHSAAHEHDEPLPMHVPGPHTLLLHTMPQAQAPPHDTLRGMPQLSLAL